MQGHRTTVLDPLLADGYVELDTSLGIPRARSGKFALTYKISAQGRDYAFRCFQMERKGMYERYSAIQRSLRRRSLPYFMDFSFLREGIRVNGKTYPALRMDWAEGQPLGTYIEKNLKKPARLRNLLAELDAVALALEEAGIAHGDIQGGNLLVDSTGQVVLVDYDGMFVPSLAAQKALETGHRNFQHPQRERVKPFDPSLDRFAFALLHSSLSALIERSTLWDQLNSDPEGILLRESDFKDPLNSTAFSTLRQLPVSGERFEHLTAICLAPYEQIPTFTNFLAGKKIPTSASPLPAGGPKGSSSNQAKLSALRLGSTSSAAQPAALAKAGVQGKVSSGNTAKLAGLSGHGGYPPKVPPRVPTPAGAPKDESERFVQILAIIVVSVLGLLLFLAVAAAAVGAAIISAADVLDEPRDFATESQAVLNGEDAAGVNALAGWCGTCRDETDVTTKAMRNVSCSDPSADVNPTLALFDSALFPGFVTTRGVRTMQYQGFWPDDVIERGGVAVREV
jgi:hypothetical protein